VLNLLFLVEQGLLSMPILYLSQYFIAHRADYYRLLLKVTTDAAWEEWIIYNAAGGAGDRPLDDGQDQRDPRPAG
jgi:Fic family protein